MGKEKKDRERNCLLRLHKFTAIVFSVTSQHAGVVMRPLSEYQYPGLRLSRILITIYREINVYSISLVFFYIVMLSHVANNLAAEEIIWGA